MLQHYNIKGVAKQALGHSDDNKLFNIIERCGEQ